MRKTSSHSVSHTPRYNKNSSYGVTCQPKHQKELGKAATRGESKQRLIACLVIILGIVWVIAALITQIPVLLAGVLLLARELAYSLHRAIDVLLSR